MIDYRAGVWGFHVAFGWNGSLAPRALCMAIPNALLTLLCCYIFETAEDPAYREDKTADHSNMVIASFTSVMIFILYNRSNTAYDRWWEGGTLLQKTRGEWFNAYSSIMAFTSTKPEMQHQVDAYVHLLARLMSLLMCCGLQQVSPNRDRPFEIIDLEGIEPASMEFLNTAPDKVEIILQWIQRSMVLHAHTGVLPVPPPILSRAFQEVSRGIVNLQNARKIADFPYPYPLAQVSMILQLVHYALVPVTAALGMSRGWAIAFSFWSIFVLWCIHFNALDLEFPFGSRINDLPMHEMQQEWNKSVCTLLAERASRPPQFHYEADFHQELHFAMSDASDLYVPTLPVVDKGVSTIRIDKTTSTVTTSTAPRLTTSSTISGADAASRKKSINVGPTKSGTGSESLPLNHKASANAKKEESSAADDSRTLTPAKPQGAATATDQVELTLVDGATGPGASPPKPGELSSKPAEAGGPSDPGNSVIGRSNGTENASGQSGDNIEKDKANAKKVTIQTGAPEEDPRIVPPRGTQSSSGASLSGNPTVDSCTI
eukprot:TRINITY_DN31635_c0_g3_i1.p1 TRINITY_DN31635_c0_g3~~TRINITY_DN31635_c0_g3_i1.p1  ORF type:complete len:545 (+),score=61.72 TRINITY_DN31635_c0_g3_i1:139-1773(+)